VCHCGRRPRCHKDWMKLRSMIVARGWRHVLTKRHDAVTEAMKTRLEIG
jgi:hypothetical protein